MNVETLRHELAAACTHVRSCDADEAAAAIVYHRKRSARTLQALRDRADEANRARRRCAELRRKLESIEAP